MINILQIGIGPLGQKINDYINQKQSLQTVGIIDTDESKVGKDLSDLYTGASTGITICKDISQIKNIADIDIVILATSSSMISITPQIEKILEYNLPIISTCEELTFPWENHPELSRRIDAKAKQANVAVVSTGVNPGFLMDTLPSMMTSVSKSVQHIEVRRIQDAKLRRIPFQQKIGAGLSINEFNNRKESGVLRHVGLTESMQFISNSLGWKLDHLEDVITPIIAHKEIQTRDMTIPKGHAMGVRQIGTGKWKNEEKISLVFEAAVGLGESYDEIKIKGEPEIHSKIKGGVHGDIATCSIVLNAIPNILQTSPGLKTMKDIPIVSCTN